MSLSLHVDLSTLDRLAARIKRISHTSPRKLLEDAGAVLESSARRRIDSEKRGPGGDPWPQWSPGYAKSRHGGQSLLSSGGDLLDSLRQDLQATGLEVGSDLPYAALHQFGGAEVGMATPARPYLGISTQDEEEILAAVDSWIDDILGDLR